MAERRYTVLFYTAVLTAAVATFGVYRVLQASKAKSQVATQPVVVATADLPEGSSLSQATIEVRRWPVGTAPEGAFASQDSLLGRVTRVAVYSGEVIVPGRLAPVGTGPGLEVKIGPGKRAMAVKIDDVAGISGLIPPNSRVDVVVTLAESSGERLPVAKVFMENVRVLSVGTSVQRDIDGKPINATTATLEVTPDEAERLAVAANEGSIQLVLRGFGDPDSVTTTGAYTRDVLVQLSGATPPAPARVVSTGEVSRPRRRAPRVEKPETRPLPPPVVVETVAAPPPPRPESLSVTIYRGDKVEQKKFEKPDSTAKRIKP